MNNAPSNKLLEQRQGVRKPLKVKIMLALDGGAVQIGRTTDVCAAGIGVELPQSVRAGQQGQVMLQFYMDGQARQMNARVKVSHCTCGADGFRAGLIFTEIGPADMATVAACLK